MYSPKELEGEVDHSFFDSDCDVSGTKPEKPVDQEKEDGDAANKKLPDQTINPPISQMEEKECGSVKTEETETDKSGVAVLEKEMSRLGSECNKDVGSRKEDEKEENENRDGSLEHKDDVKREEAACGKEDSDTSSRKSSPLPCSHLSRSSRGSESDDSSIICSSSSSSAAEEGNAAYKKEYDGRRCRELAKRFTGKLRVRSHSHSSSSSSREGSPTALAKSSNTPSTSSPQRQPRPGSAVRKQRAKTSETDDSDDTVTDVTPLSSPDVSPQQSFDLAPATSSKSTVHDTLETVDGQQLDANMGGVERSGRPTDRALLVSSPGSASVGSRRSSAGRHRKNFSFPNGEVRRIERENQRLLHELSRASTRSSSRSTRHSPTPPFRLYHSGLNRQREQQRIQQENLAILKRLDSVKATPGMTRLEQLTDYQRQAGYLGIPTAVTRPTSGRTSRSCSSTSPHRTRVETAKPTRSTPPRPAWS